MGVDTNQFEAGEGSHLDLLAVQGVGGQLAGGVVVAPNFSSVVCTPGAVDAGNQGAVLQLTGELFVLQGDEAGVLADINDSLGNVSARSFVPVADGVHAVISQAQVQASASIEAVQVPAVSNVHRDFLACGGCLIQHRVKALDVILGEEGFIIEHEVAVISGQGVSIQLAVHGCSVNRSRAIAVLDIVSVQLNFLQGACLNQLVQLVIGKSVNVSSNGGVGQDGILGCGLGLSAQVDGDLAAVIAVFFDKVISDGAQQFLVFLGAPHGQGNVVGESSGCSLLQNVTIVSCGAVGGGGFAGSCSAGGLCSRFCSGRGSCGAAACCQGQCHQGSCCKCELLFHNHSPSSAISQASQGCASSLRSFVSQLKNTRFYFQCQCS